MVWQWQRNRDHRERVSRSGVAPPAPPEAAPDSGPLSDPAFVAGLRAVPSASSDSWPRRPAADLAGVSPEGQRLEVRLADHGPLVLLAFLTTHCDGCDEFWAGPDEATAVTLPASVSTLVVTKGPETVDPAEVIRLASGRGGTPVIMSDEAWADYQVMGYPFFVLVDASDRCVVGETVGFGWADIADMIHSAIGERR